MCMIDIIHTTVLNSSELWRISLVVDIFLSGLVEVNSFSYFVQNNKIHILGVELHAILKLPLPCFGFLIFIKQQL